MKIVIVLFYLLTLLSSPAAFAEETVNIDSKGNVYFGELRRALLPEEKEAISKPGEKIPVWDKFSLERQGFFHGSLKKESSTSLLYLQHEKRIETIKENLVFQGKPSFLWQVVFLLIGMVFQTIASFCFWKRIYPKFFAFSLLTIFFFGLSLVFFPSCVKEIILPYLAYITSIFSFTVSNKYKECKWVRIFYWFGATVCYILCAIAFWS